jgi:hypothetical protein
MKSLYLRDVIVEIRPEIRLNKYIASCMFRSGSRISAIAILCLLGTAYRIVCDAGLRRRPTLD